MWIRTSVLLAVLLPAMVLASDVYKSVDQDGNAVYSDRPPDGSDQTVSIAISGSSWAQGAASDDTEDAAANDGEKSEAELRCELAQSILQRYESADYLFEKTDDGSERVLSDEDMATKIQGARSDVDRFCADQGQ